MTAYLVVDLTQGGIDAILSREVQKHHYRSSRVYRAKIQIPFANDIVHCRSNKKALNENKQKI